MYLVTPGKLSNVPYKTSPTLIDRTRTYDIIVIVCTILASIAVSYGAYWFVVKGFVLDPEYTTTELSILSILLLPVLLSLYGIMAVRIDNRLADGAPLRSLVVGIILSIAYYIGFKHICPNYSHSFIAIRIITSLFILIYWLTIGSYILQLYRDKEEHKTDDKPFEDKEEHKTDDENGRSYYHYRKMINLYDN